MEFETFLYPNPAGISNKAKTAIRKTIRRLAISPGDMSDRLKGYLTKREGVRENEISLFHGSTQCLESILRLTKPESVLVPGPLSRRYDGILQSMNLKTVVFPVSMKDGFVIDLDELATACRKTSALIFPYPHDVTGTGPDFEAFCRLLDELSSTGKTVIIDEAYREYGRLPSPVKYATVSLRTVIVRTFSTFHGLAGLPLAVCIGPSAFIRAVNDFSPAGPIDRLSSSSALASLRDKGFQKRTGEYLSREKVFLTKRLQSLSFLSIMDTPCDFMILGFSGNRTNLKQRADTFGLSLDLCEDSQDNVFIRLPVGEHAANARVARLLRSMEKKDEE